MALGSTKPPTEMSTRNLPGVKGGQRMRLTTSSPSVSWLSRKWRSLDFSQLYGPSQICIISVYKCDWCSYMKRNLLLEVLFSINDWIFVQCILAGWTITIMFSSLQFSPRRILESYFPNGPLNVVTSDIGALTFPDFDCSVVNQVSLQNVKNLNHKV
jgi:hypothetical protein